MLARLVAAAVLFAISGNAQFEIRGSRLFLDGSPFTVRGVAYSPTPIGQIPPALLSNSGCLYARDLPLMARAGINTVRVYGRIASEERAFWQILESSGLYLLAGFPLEPYYDSRATLSPGAPEGRALRARILADLQDYAAQVRDRRRVMAIIFGNEVVASYNAKFAGAPRDFYSLVEEAAGVWRAAVGASGPLLTTAVADVSDIGQATLSTRDSDQADLAFWSVNSVRGAGFGRLFDELRRKTAKAVLISEFGADAWDSFRQVEDADAQAIALRNLLRQLRQETERTGSTVIGGAWWEWSDEWWRGGPDPSRHGSANPAWFGLFGLLATEVPGLDSLRARPAFAALAEEWGEKFATAKAPQLSPQGVVNAASTSTSVAPGGLVSFFGEELAAAARAADSPLPLHIGLTSACMASRPLPLLFVDPGQINAQAPWEMPLGRAAALVYRAGVATNVVSVDVREFSPGILDRGVLPWGKPCPVTVTNGVRPGTYLEIYGTGLGAAFALASGMPAPAARPIDNLPRAFLGSRELAVLYSGVVPGLVGLYQTNTRVPDDFPAGSPVGLRLLAGGVESNTYPITVLGDSDQPGFTLGAGPLTFAVQPGGPGQSAQLSIEGQNGFCDLVRFAVSGLPDGVSVSLPVGLPGQSVPVTVQASTQARGNQEIGAVISAFSTVSQNPTARLRITVLPSQGDIPFRIVSGGGRAGLIARFEMAGRLMHEARGGGPGRGFNFLAINGDSGVLGAVRVFDTWSSDTASEAMADYLSSLPAGAVVLGAIADEGTLHLTARARAVLRQVLRSRLIDALRYQDSWAIIARVGSATPIAEEAAPDRQAVLERVLTFPAP